MGNYWDEFKSSQASTAIKQGFIAFSDEQVAKKLSEAGIPGIKYLDQGSRRRPKEEAIAELEKTKEDLAYAKANPDEYERLQNTDIVKITSRMEDKIKALESEISTGPEKQTSNLVVFDPKDIQITHKDGKPVNAHAQRQLKADLEKSGEAQKV